MQSIKNKDIKEYLYLLQEKNLFQTEKFKKMISLVEANEGSTLKSRNMDQEAVAICFLGVAIYVGLATVAETYVMVHHKFAMWGMSENEVQNVFEEEFIDENVMKVWSIKGKSLDTYHTDDVVENSLTETSATISSIIDASANEKEIVKKITRSTVNKYRGEQK